MKQFLRAGVCPALLAMALTPAGALAAPKPPPPPVPATDSPAAAAAAGRAVLKRYADAVVSVELVTTIKLTVGNRSAPPRENRIEVNGTVISPTGLTITALSLIDPRSTLENLLRAQPAASAQHIEMGETEYKQVKISLSDGTEIPAHVVLKDADLDLAFVAPDPAPAGAAGGRTFSYVNLDNAAEAEVLGTYFDVARAPKALQRTPTVRMTNVVGIVEKPRRAFMVSIENPGCLVFDAQQRVLGICARHVSAGRDGAYVVLPAADIADIAKQAAVAKPIDEPPPDDTKPAPEPADAGDK